MCVQATRSLRASGSVCSLLHMLLLEWSGALCVDFDSLRKMSAGNDYKVKIIDQIRFQSMVSDWCRNSEASCYSLRHVSFPPALSLTHSGNLYVCQLTADRIDFSDTFSLCTGSRWTSQMLSLQSLMDHAVISAASITWNGLYRNVCERVCLCKEQEKFQNIFLFFLCSSSLFNYFSLKSMCHKFAIIRSLL